LNGFYPGLDLEYVTNTDRLGIEGTELNTIVCIKQIPDPEIPPAKFRLDSEGKQVVPPEGIPPVINPYDAQAVELALKLRDEHGGRITVLSLGDITCKSAVKRALSMGADEGIVLNDQKFEGSDSFSTAYILTRAIQKIGKYDLILCGREAADWDNGLVGSIIAEYLDLPLITLAGAIDIEGDELRIKRMTLYGYQIFTVRVPAVVTTSNEVGQPRMPTGWGIISAARSQIPVWNAQDIDADPHRIGASAARTKLIKLFAPKRERAYEIIEGETTVEAAEKLAERLRQAGVI